MHSQQKRSVRVFIATPGDLVDERHEFSSICETFHDDHPMVELIPLGWELLTASVGPRPQDRINELVDQCDVFVLAMHRHWGQEATDASPSTSYTEEELRRAISRLGRTGTPEVFCLFKQLDPATLADPGPQLQKVLDLKQSLESSKQVLYKTFGTTEDFGNQLRAHLDAFASGTLPSPRNSPKPIHLPVIEDQRPSSDEEEVARALARQGKVATEVGQYEEAAHCFARVAQQTNNVRLLDLVQEFFRSRGEDTTAERVLDKRLALTKDRRTAARLHVATMGESFVDPLVATLAPQFDVEDRAHVAAMCRDIFLSAEWNEQLVNDMAEHLTVWELRALQRFYAGEGRSITKKMGEFMGETIPRAVDFVEQALRRRGLGR